MLRGEEVCYELHIVGGLCVSGTDLTVTLTLRISGAAAGAVHYGEALGISCRTFRICMTSLCIRDSESIYTLSIILCIITSTDTRFAS